MKIVNLGKRNEQKVYDAVQSTSMPGKAKTKVSISYPEFSVEDINLPIDSTDVGKIITATVQLKVKRAGNEINYENKKQYRASFCVVSLGFQGVKKGVDIKNMSKDELDAMEQDEHGRISISKKKGY